MILASAAVCQSLAKDANKFGKLTGEDSILSAVATDRFDRASFHRFFTKTFFLGRFRLFVNVGVTAVVIALEIRGRSFPAQIAVDALLIDIEFAGGVLRIFVGGVGHKVFVEGAGNIVETGK